MTDSTQVIKIKCPHCGWVRSVDLKILTNESEADIVRGGLSNGLKEALQHIQAAMSNPKLDEAVTWIDMPKCPECGNVYKFNTHTRETMK